MTFGERSEAFGFLVHDRNAKFTAAFDAVFELEGVRVIRHTGTSTTGNAVTERWAGTARRECLDRMLTLPRQRLQATLCSYVEHYNAHRPHRALGMRPPAPRGCLRAVGKVPPTVTRHDVLDGLIHEYQIAA